MAGNSSTKSGSSTSHDPDVKGDLDSLKEDFADLKKDLKHLVESALGEGRQSAEHAQERVEKKFDQTTDSLQKNIVDNPFTSVGIAAVIGIVLGLFFSRK